MIMIQNENEKMRTCNSGELSAHNSEQKVQTILSKMHIIIEKQRIVIHPTKFHKELSYV